MKRALVCIAALCILCLYSNAQNRYFRIASSGNSRFPGDVNKFVPLKLDKPLQFGGSYISRDYEFALYLLDNKLDKDALTLAVMPLYQPSDTLDYLRGRILFSQHYLEDATKQFNSVPASSSFYDNSVFYGVASLAWLGRYSQASEILRSYAGPYIDIKQLQMSGLALLERDYDSYRGISTLTHSNSHYAISIAAQDLSKVASAMQDFRPKSPIVAGFASAIVPGLGSVYCGKIGEGVASFLSIALCSAMAAENYAKCGACNWKTICFSAFGGVFYLLNIYGSCVSVKVYNERMIDQYETAVLLDINIPLHSVLR